MRTLEQQQGWEMPESTTSHEPLLANTSLHGRISSAVSGFIPTPPVDVEMEDIAVSIDSEEKICYGALCHAKAQLNSLIGSAVRSSPWARFQTFSLVASEEHFDLIQMEGTCPKVIGKLDLITTGHIRALATFSGLLFAAVVALSDLHALPRKQTRKHTIIDISINIIGPKSVSRELGDRLASSSAYLQHPIFLQCGIRYINPQYFYLGDEQTDLNHLIGPPVTDTRSRHISEELKKILGSLDDPWDNAVIPEDHAVPIAAVDRLILARLKRHQETGLRFILNRENATFCDSVNSDLKSLIGSRALSHSPALCLGGILADVMGLGKTLTMLSAVACSKEAATQFAGNKYYQPELKLTRATLIVVTSTQILDVWRFEIEKHLKPNTFSIALFHGHKRAMTPEALVDHDIVLTTYTTLSSDWKGRQVLQKMGWFRVVLDEAHWIRNQSSQQFKSTQALQAERRWCLTGTPIQNSLHDVRSLLKFLRFEPFASPAFFEKHIIEPLRSDSPESLRNLKLLLRIICLRRNESYLHLPSVKTEEITIDLAAEEIAEYESILADCKAEFDIVVSSRSKVKKCNVLFSSVMKLRRLCNHGTFRTTTTIHPELSKKRRRSGEQVPASPRQLICEFCGGLLDSSIHGSGHFEDCQEFFGGLESEDGPVSDPLCGSAAVNSPTGSLTPSAYSSQGSAAQYPSPIFSNSPFEPQHGYSSKLNTVADNIQRSLENSKTDSKNLVFTSWPATLDILAKLLADRGISSEQIDGRVKFPDRPRILAKFCENYNIPVLLLTFQTGAVGLTLTAANRVHIVEPHWNPSTEDQAIARALRIGQTREVTIIKYITTRTVEQNIVTLQKKKRQLAKFSLDGGADNDVSGRLDDFKFILDMGDGH